MGMGFHGYGCGLPWKTPGLPVTLPTKKRKSAFVIWFDRIKWEASVLRVPRSPERNNAHILFIYFAQSFWKTKKKHEVSICNIIWLDKREASALWVPCSLERNTLHILFIYFARGYFLKKIKYNYDVSSGNIIWSNKGEASAFWAPRSLEKKKKAHILLFISHKIIFWKTKKLWSQLL